MASPKKGPIRGARGRHRGPSRQIPPCCCCHQRPVDGSAHPIRWRFLSLIESRGDGWCGSDGMAARAPSGTIRVRASSSAFGSRRLLQETTNKGEESGEKTVGAKPLQVEGAEAERRKKRGEMMTSHIPLFVRCPVLVHETRNVYFSIIPGNLHAITIRVKELESLAGLMSCGISMLYLFHCRSTNGILNSPS